MSITLQPIPGREGPKPSKAPPEMDAVRRQLVAAHGRGAIVSTYDARPFVPPGRSKAILPSLFRSPAFTPTGRWAVVPVEYQQDGVTVTRMKRVRTYKIIG